LAIGVRAAKLGRMAIVSTPQSPYGRFILFLAIIGGIALITAIVVGALAWRSDTIATPADVIGAPVRAQTPAGDRIFLLTSQWKTWKPFTSARYASSSPTYTDLLIDVWAFDATSGEMVWTRQLEADRSGTNMGRALLGADAGAVWVLAGDGLVGLSPKDGSIVADVARLEAANPTLKGLMPKEPDLYKFGPAGLSLTAADGRRWRMAGEGLKVAPEGEPGPAGPVFPPARWSGGVGTWMFHEKGVHIGQTRWLGVLSEAEAAKSRETGTLALANAEEEPRGRLWSAWVRKKPTHFGSERVYERFEPLPQGPEFVQAGLLSDGKDNALPILPTGPDSVLVLHRDRLDDEGRWRVSRVAGPAGNVLWTAELGMKRLDAVMPGETSLAIQGSRPERDPLRPIGEVHMTDVDVLAVIDLASGKASVHRFFPKPAK
jgi:hypothetical protein